MRINDTPPTTLRVSPGAFERVNAALEKIGAEPETVEESTITLKNPGALKKGIEKSRAFREGLVSIQDQGAIEIVEALSPEPGDSVLDMCAAPGGKTGHIAQLTDGEVLACDIYPNRLSLVKENAERLGLTNVKTALQDGTVHEAAYEEHFDRVLIDAPCSGLGVIRRKPDIRYRVREEGIGELTGIQSELIENAYSYLKPGGEMVYSTCTVGKAENEDIVENLLKNHPGAKLLKSRHTGEDEGDQFYYALIKKNED